MRERRGPRMRLRGLADAEEKKQGLQGALVGFAKDGVDADDGARGFSQLFVAHAY